MHSQLSAMHLAQQSVLLSAFISPTMMQAALSTNPFTALPGFPPHNTAPTSTPAQEPVKEPARKRQRRQCDFHAFCLCCCFPFLMVFFVLFAWSRCNSRWFFLAESRPAALTSPTCGSSLWTSEKSFNSAVTLLKPCLYLNGRDKRWQRARAQAAAESAQMSSGLLRWSSDEKSSTSPFQS